jgi:hypothetical protein
VANIESPWEQISCVPVLRTLRPRWEAGTVHEQEAHVLTERLETLSAPPGPSASWSMPSADGGMRIADPTRLTALVTPDLSLAQVADSP